MSSEELIISHRRFTLAAVPKATKLAYFNTQSVCDEILGLFPEENVGLFAVLLTCDALRTAVAGCADMERVDIECHAAVPYVRATRTGRCRAVRT